MKTLPDWKLDHITVVARTLEDGAAHIRDQLGIDMPPGGTHPRMKTYNRLLSLGDDLFLELIAIDPEAAAPDRPRWFNLDRFDGEPCLNTWVLSIKDIETSLVQAHPKSGLATEITRGDLNWLISIPQNGSMPMDGAFPTLIEWPAGQHPAAKMTDLGCRLHSLTIEHPEADEILARVENRIDTSQIAIRNGSTKMIRAEIDTPSGLRVLV